MWQKYPDPVAAQGMLKILMMQNIHGIDPHKQNLKTPLKQLEKKQEDIYIHV